MSDQERPDFATRFKPGNQFWKARSKHGRDKIFSDPNILWEACLEYFQWVEDNPLWEVKSYQYQGVPLQDTIPKMRAMTIGGLCIFLGIDTETWTRYKVNPDFCGVQKNVELIIRDQKFTGASADLLNPAIIARELGLADKSELNHGGQPDNPIKQDVKYIVEFVNAPERK